MDAGLLAGQPFGGEVGKRHDSGLRSCNLRKAASSSDHSTLAGDVTGSSVSHVSKASTQSFANRTWRLIICTGPSRETR